MIGNGLDGLGSGIIFVACEGEVAVRSLRVTAEGCTIKVEAEARCKTVIGVTHIAGGTRISIWTSLLEIVCSIHAWDELDKERLRLWEIWLYGWWSNSETLGEVEMMVWTENWLWLRERAIVADAQRWDVIKLDELACGQEPGDI